MRVSEIRVNQIRVNQGLGVQSIHFCLHILRFELKNQVISHIIIQKLCNLIDF